MPPSDQEPRYQLVDSNGNVVGSLFGDGSGNVVIADETDTQTTFGPNGITTPALEAEKADTRSGYQDVTSSRSLLTTETNNTGSDLNVNVTMTATDQTRINSRLDVDGAPVDEVNRKSTSSVDRDSLTATIQAGSTYTVRDFNDGTIENWVEQS